MAKQLKGTKDISISENVDNEAEEEGIHMHCFTCYKTSCDVIKHCDIIECPNNCGVKYHRCKHAEHEHVCLRAKRECINHYFGCPFIVDSVMLMSHLEYCPASVIHCGMSWNRYPLYSKIREEWLPFWQANPVLVKGDLDTEFAISDQTRVNQELKYRMKQGFKQLLEKKKLPRLPPNKMRRLSRALKGLHVTDNEDNDDNEVHDDLQHMETGNPIHISDPDSTEVEKTQEKSNFITYDDVHIRLMMDASGFVSNTNIRHGYYELPFKYNKKYYNNSDILTDDDSTSTGMASLRIDVSKDDIELRNKVYSKLDRLYFPLGLNVIVETMPKFQNQYPMYSFSCSKIFRRDQYAWHFKNIHQDIQPHINGWLFQRCPLSQYGCPYSQCKMKPENLKVRFSRNFSSFCTQYDRLDDICQLEKSGDTGLDNSDEIGLFDLPEELLYYLFTYMDSLAFNALAKTCTYFHNVCFNFLDTRGVVLTTWVKRNYEKLGTSWKESGQIRLFTTSCAPMGKLTFTNSPSIGNHLKDCPFNAKNNDVYNERKVCLLPAEALEMIKRRRKTKK